MRLELCKCGNIPTVKRVGDYKQFIVYACPVCGYIAAQPHEARVTERGARKVWNKALRNTGGAS